MPNLCATAGDVTFADSGFRVQGSGSVMMKARLSKMHEQSCVFNGVGEGVSAGLTNGR